MQINLIYPHSQKEILEILYTAYRICYSKKTVSDIIEEIKSGKISETQIKKFLRARFKTGHTSPLRQIHFTFTIEGVSRVLTAQFNRHTIGVDRCEMSQRYVNLTNEVAAVIPESLESYDVKSHQSHPADFMLEFYREAFNKYTYMQGAWGIKAEDARYLLPMGSESREQATFSFEALQNFLDVRLCSQAQNEHKEMAWKMYKIMRKRFPFLSSALGIKCWSNRLGYCNEGEKQYCKCEWSKKRPHKIELMKLWKTRK